jgi:hypothetical protein
MLSFDVQTQTCSSSCRPAGRLERTERLAGALDADAFEPVRGAVEPGVTEVGILAR